MSISKKVINGKVKWIVDFRLYGRNDRRLQRRFDKRADAVNLFNEVMARVNDKANPLVNAKYDLEETFLNRELDYWLTMKKEEISQGYLRALQNGIKLIRKHYGHLSVARFTPQLLHEFRNLLRDKGLSPATQNRYTDIICRVLRFSLSHKRIAFDPTIGFKKVKEITDGLSFWSENEVMEFLSFADKKYPFGSKDRWVYVAYLFALETGVRARELWAIKPQDIPANENKIRIARQYLSLNKFGPTKGRDNRFVPLSEGLKREINAWLSMNNNRANETIFVGKTRKPVMHDRFTTWKFRIDLKESGLRKIRFHDLRHTALTMMVLKNVNIWIVQKIAGHKDIKTTMRYVHILGKDVDQVGANLGLVNEIPATQKTHLSLIS